MKSYDYKDETKDVRGKVTHFIYHTLLLTDAYYRLRD